MSRPSSESARRPTQQTIANIPWIDAAALAALAALTLGFFWKITLTNRVLVGLDVFTYFYPYRDFASEALRAGHLPLWNPYLFMGAPLLANSQVAVLYPLHWPLIWLSAPKQVAWSIAIHIWLASAGTYLFARAAARLRPLAAFVAAVIFALGGFLGAQVEHLNQLNASAWLPWLLLCLEAVLRPGRGRWLALLGGAVTVSLALLAGHTQAAYILMFGAGFYALLKGRQDFRQRRILPGLRGVGFLAAMTLTGLILAAGQLLPTLELSRWSVRSGGLPYNEAASFSLRPGLVFKAFLPPLLWEPPFSEFVAYVGLVGLALGIVGASAVVRRQRPGGGALGLALIGIFLAFGAYNPVYYLLYKLVPGFDLFRAPARWLLLYAFGAALLAGTGLEILTHRARSQSPERYGLVRAGRIAARLGLTAVVLLMVFELFAAGRRLAYNQPTAPAAYDSMRTAPSHLLADQVFRSGDSPFRFLSMSDIRYDPGDLADLQLMYESTLSEQALYDLVVATKMKEVLAFNLPLRYRLFSVDGYDGGLLPIQSYVSLERLFLAEDEIWPDGRLRQQLSTIPPARLLSLLNVKYVLTDKTQDVWIDDVFYDLEHTVLLGEVVLDDLPDLQATHLGVLSYLTGTASLSDGTPVAEITITGTGDQGQELTHTAALMAGEHTSEGLYVDGQLAHRQARVGHSWRDNELGSDYLAVLELDPPLQPGTISVRSLLPGEQFHLRGLSLIDETTGTSGNVSIAPTLPLVHSGDVKIYQNLDVLPRAYVVHEARWVPDESAVLELLRDPGFDPGLAVILVSNRGQSGAEQPLPPLESGEDLGQAQAGPGGQASPVEILAYEPERVELRVDLETAGYLVLSDTFYPGWKARVDGNVVPIHQANLYFRAVELPPGKHAVEFRYGLETGRLGLGLSLAGWLLWSLAAIVAVIRTGRNTASSV